MANSITKTGFDGGIVELCGLKADLSNLPVNVPTGSTFYTIDTKELYMFERTSQTWYKQ